MGFCSGFLLKRILDLFFSISLLIFGIPLFLLLSFLILFKLNRPIFFIQKRAGYKGGIFHLIKFRTMLNIRDENGDLLSNEKRTTSFGNFLRKTSLDELPSLINVIKGELSLVGPRPLLPEYLPFYSKEQNRRHDVKPGITGWAQIKGRNAIDWEERFKLDVWYVDNWSLLLDIKILFLTLGKVIKKQDVQPENKFTIDRFDEIQKSKK